MIAIFNQNIDMEKNIQNQIMKGIAALAKTKDEVMFAELMVTISQCIEKNIQLITFYERLSLFPEFAKEIEPYTGLTMDDLDRFYQRSDIAPITPEGIVSLDRNIKYQLCPCRHLTETSQRHLLEESKHFHPKKEGEISRLYTIISEQEQIIRILRSQVAKGTALGMYQGQESQAYTKFKEKNGNE